jgi:hypothetical protein
LSKESEKVESSKRKQLTYPSVFSSETMGPEAMELHSPTAESQPSSGILQPMKFFSENEHQSKTFTGKAKRRLISLINVSFF